MILRAFQQNMACAILDNLMSINSFDEFGKLCPSEYLLLIKMSSDIGCVSVTLADATINKLADAYKYIMG